MSLDLNVLRALLRLARRGAPVTPRQLLDRVDADLEEVDAALDRLARAELVLRLPTGPRLTLAGLAVAASTVPAVAEPKTRAARAKRPVRMGPVLPLVRRHRAA